MVFVGIADKQLAVSERLPADRLPKEYQAVDIRKGDIILMVDGKRMFTPEQLEKHYDSVAVGQEMKLGLKRGNDMLIASFKKADPSTLPQMKRIVMTADGQGDEGKPGGKALSIDGDAVPILELGVIFAAKDGAITVADVLPVPGVSNLKSEPHKGDRLISLQGASFTTAASLIKAWDNITVGDTVRIILSRGGKETLSVFAKPKAVGEVRLKGSK
ncbi:hypothetical protein C3F09_04220 [candidate division GN15 bacterium]|uniref:PDZ domain-containing protein n=1 Tax=candidate division GN15 bacterium TaxID=2072418 RepID=A0A855X9Z9_9BACT|nr:MAG: hypothetical protein C3F09_04220 [candidate division GN15 bacterium]